MGKSESTIQQEIQIEAAKHSCVLLRNNSGARRNESGALYYYGLGVVSKKQNKEIKSPDLVGYTTMRIEPCHLGKYIAVFTGVEVKEEGWKFNPKDNREMAQKRFLNKIKLRGGFSGFAQSVEDLKRIIPT